MKGVRSVIKRCAHCNVYTMKSHCPKCEKPTEHALPPKYGPEDRWGKYRRKLKYEKRES